MTTKAEQPATTAATEADIFDVPAGNLSTGGGGGEAYKATEGIHQATVVGILDMGMQDNTFKPGTQQRKGQLLFALNDQNVVFTNDDGTEEDTGEPITITSKPYTISFHEKSSLLKDVTNMGIKVDEAKTTLASLLGIKCMVICSRDEDGRVNISAFSKPAKVQADPAKPVYAPTFWYKNKDNTAGQYRMKLHPTLTIAGERPKREKK